MADIKGLAEKRTTIRVSSSIANFREALFNYLKLPEWHWWRNRHDRVIFFGLYHWKDYVRFFWHRGPKKVFWCGSDILAIRKTWWFILIILGLGQHYCENEVEQRYLKEAGIDAEIRPMFFDDPNNYPVTFQPSPNPQVWISVRPGRELEYGIDIVRRIAYRTRSIQYHVYGWEPDQGAWPMNMLFHGEVSNEELNNDIRYYQSALRLNKFDGFAEVLAKSVLLGQYPITAFIEYGNGITFCRDEDHLVNRLNRLKTRTLPNSGGRHYWLKQFERSKNEVIYNW